VFALENAPRGVADHPGRHLRPREILDDSARPGELRLAHPEAVGVGDQHMDEAVLHQENGELPDLFGEPIQEARRRDLRKNPVLNPVQEAVRVFPEVGVPLHVAQDRPVAADLQVPEEFMEILRHGFIGELQKDVAAAVVQGKEAPGLEPFRDAGVDPEFRPCVDLQGDHFRGQAHLKLRKPPQHRLPVVFVLPQDPVGRADHLFDAVLHGDSRHRERLLPVGGPVVQPRQYVAVHVNHTQL